MMFLLDTNMLSELMRPQPEARVLDWVAGHPLSEMAVAAITVMEIRFGIATLPDGKRRAGLDGKFRQLLTQGFSDRVLPFDQAAADTCAELRAYRKRIGRPITTEDGMIAAIARTHGAAIATRDASGFEGCGLNVINPWEE